MGQVVFASDRQKQLFWEKVRKTATCWLWTAHRNSDDYGRFNNGGRLWLAHRLSYEVYRGAVEPGLELHHTCEARPCVNPDHLVPVTHAENVRRSRSWWAQKTHCPRGHPYSGENLLIQYGGGRVCRICRKDTVKRHLARKASHEGLLPRKTHCKRGHEYTPVNTYLDPSGGRRCRECSRARRRARK